MLLQATSSKLALIMNGKILHIFNPWTISISKTEEYIKVTKRNWYLIGRDEQILAFRYIRNITIDRHLFGADIHIKIMGGKISAYCISKRAARKIRNHLLEYNQTKKGRGIIFS
jgi:hypothetical protein